MRTRAPTEGKLHHISRAVAVVAVIVLAYAQTPGAAAVHLFPLFPGDPTGDCAAGLAADPGDADATVLVEGFFFLDSSVEIEVGQTVTWEWIQYCHSVTSTSVPGGAQAFTTFGGDGSATGPVEGQDELLKPEGDNATFSQTFTVPGTYEYICVHHASVGMTGTVVVAEADDAGSGEGPGDDGTDGDGAGVLGASAELPATGGGSGLPGAALIALGLAGFALVRRPVSAS